MDKEKNNYFDDNKLFDVIASENFDEILTFLKPYGINGYDRDKRTMLTNLVIEKKFYFFSELLKLNPNVNHKDSRGYTALHFAVQEKFIHVIDMLLDRNDLEIDLKDNLGFTALSKLVREENKDNLTLIEKLIKNGSSIDSKNNRGISVRESMQEITDEDIVDYNQFL